MFFRCGGQIAIDKQLVVAHGFCKALLFRYVKGTQSLKNVPIGGIELSVTRTQLHWFLVGFEF